MAAVTRLGLYACSRRPYGDFSGKEEAEIIDITTSKGWLPVIYLDEDGRHVSRDDIKKAVVLVEEHVARESPKDVKAVRRASKAIYAALNRKSVFTGHMTKIVEASKSLDARTERLIAAFAVTQHKLEIQRENEELALILLLAA